MDGSLELLQASGFELVFDESSPEPQAAAPSTEAADTAQPSSDSQAGALPSEVSRTCERSALSFATCSQMSHGAIIRRATRLRSAS